MLRGMIIIITAFMSVIFLKRKLFVHHWSSIVVIFLGVFLVGLAAFLEKKSDADTTPTKPLGLILLIIAQFFAGTLFIVEEKLLGSYYLDPLKVVGLEGLWGLIMWCILLPIFQQIKCHTDNNELCPYDKLEDTMRAFQDYDANKILIVLSVCICCSIACFNAFGVSVTKNASAAQRSTIDSSRTVLIWIFFMIVPIYGTYFESFKVMQLFGFLLLVFGTLVFNEILVLPFLGFNKNTQAALDKKKREEKGLLDSRHEQNATNYSGMSPHAGYDATHNQRAIQRHTDEHLDGGEFNVNIKDQ